jgi:hypothetical protein
MKLPLSLPVAALANLKQSSSNVGSQPAKSQEEARHDQG